MAESLNSINIELTAATALAIALYCILKQTITSDMMNDPPQSPGLITGNDNGRQDEIQNQHQHGFIEINIIMAAAVIALSFSISHFE